MLEVARLTERDRRDLFRAAAQGMHVHEAIVEKDFWVCWALDYLFRDSPWKEVLALKGGTSLSKAFAVIERFSEDIDLILDWRALGYSEEDPWSARSATQQDRFGKEANRRTALFSAKEFTPALATALSDRLGANVPVEAIGQNAVRETIVTLTRAGGQLQL